MASYLGELNENPGSRAEKPPASAKKSKAIEKKVVQATTKKTNENHPQAAKPPIPLSKKPPPITANHESSNQSVKQECKVLKQVTNLSQQQQQVQNESTRKMPINTNDESECEFDTVNSSTNNLTDSQSFANNSCNSSSNSSTQDSTNNENNNSSGRRAKKQVSYREMPLNTKMRRDSENKICIKEKRNSQQMKIEGVDNDNSNN